MRSHPLPYPIDRWLRAILLSLLIVAGGAAPESGAGVCLEQNPAAINPGGIGGTGHLDEGGGIGGTGRQEEGGIGGTGQQAEGGIGGTGQQAEDRTSIIGAVTGFASVCLNGLEVQVDHNTVYSQNGNPIPGGALEVGQVVVIEARGGSAHLTARQIKLVNVLEGPVTQPLGQDGLIRVMDQPVRVESSTRLSGVSVLSDLKPGMTLRVSGFRVGEESTGGVVATRIEHAPNLVVNTAIGILTQSNNETSMEGLRLRGDIVSAEAKAEKQVRGRWEESALTVQDVQDHPLRDDFEAASRVVAEGVVTPGNDGHPHLRVPGLGVAQPLPRDGNAGEQLGAGQRVVVHGRLQSGRNLVIERVQRQERPTRPGEVRPPAQVRPDEVTPLRGALPRPERPPRIDRLQRVPVHRPPPPPPPPPPPLLPPPR